MKLREYILSEKNIYLAIYAVRSYVFNPQLLDKDDKELLNLLMDPFNEKLIFNVIEDVKTIIKDIIDNEKSLFKTEVYYKPKEYCDDKCIYRPIHTAKLKQLIAMVAVMHPLVYENVTEDDNWDLKLSNYSRLIPNNFYGNRVSKKPEELFKKWNVQYKKYTQKANEYFKTFHESKEYKFELKLDLQNFFPSINPLVVYGILLENMPVTLNDPEDVFVFKTIIYKLLICEITNLTTDLAKERYYEKADINVNCTRGIPQGLPQSYFFGNICMIKISEIFDKVYDGKSVYYVDDSYIYTNSEIVDQDSFEKKLDEINAMIQTMVNEYVKLAKMDELMFDNQSYSTLSREITDDDYVIKVHPPGKSTYVDIQKSKEGEIYLQALSREASQISTDIMSTYSEEEDKAMLHRTKALIESIEKERNSGIEDCIGYKEKLERYYKFFKYREIKLQLKTEKDDSLIDRFNVLLNNEKHEEDENIYEALEKIKIDVKLFFDNYKHDIWQAAISLLIANTVQVAEHDKIRIYIKNIINAVYPSEMSKCSFIQKMYTDYLASEEVENISNSYATLEKQTRRKFVRYANMNTSALKDMFEGVKFEKLNENILTSYGICSKKFIDASKIVDCNSNRLQRMFLNAVYSKVFKVVLSEDVVLSSYDKKGITYGELRILVYLRNPNCNISQFLKLPLEIMRTDNLQNIDYTVFEVLGAYRKYVKIPEHIDNLIMVHKYTCDVWKNGAKHLYFYTLHNQEHAIDLVKNIIKIVKVFSYLKISNYDYYLLFIACYLHDISMVRIASENDFLLDKDDSDKITTELDYKWSKCRTTSDTKKAIIETYKKIDSFFEDKIRSKHAKDSAVEIRKRKELDFLETSVRENVAEIAEGHMMDAKDIYYAKGDAKNRLVSYKFDKILLRFADLLDMSERRVSKPILNHNLDNMSSVSAFHWVSHLLTEGYTLIPYYEMEEDKSLKSNLSPGSIREKIELSISVNLSQFSKMESIHCAYGKVDEGTLCENSFVIELLKEGERCDSKKCNFLCRWFNDKNYYLIQEMQALEKYLSRIPVAERFYNTKILIKVKVKNPTNISDEQFEILKKKISG